MNSLCLETYMQESLRLSRAMIPSFSVMSKGKRVETLIHCFMSVQDIRYNPKDSAITARNGEMYIRIYDNVHWRFREQPFKALISFQKHTYGNFAIIREYSEEEDHGNEQ